VVFLLDLLMLLRKVPGATSTPTRRADGRFILGLRMNCMIFT